MGAFWIFAAILTFVYIVYYAVIMAMDTVGDKGKKKKDVEVFAVGNSSQEAFVEEPTFIKEKEALPDTSSAKQEPPPSPSENGCLGCIIEGRTAITTPPKPL